jgi:hypothetical protein
LRREGGEIRDDFGAEDSFTLGDGEIFLKSFYVFGLQGDPIKNLDPGANVIQDAGKPIIPCSDRA